MKFEKETLKTLVALEYKIENKIEEDLIKSGFKLKRRTLIPKSITDLVGEIKIE